MSTTEDQKREPAQHGGGAVQAAVDAKARKKAKRQAKASRGIETMFRTSYRTHLDLSGYADNKANIMISINGVIISIMIASIGPRLELNPWLLLPTSILLLSCAGSMIFAILAARPRITSRPVTLDDVRANRANILFFGNFVNMPVEDFEIGMDELMEDPPRLYANMSRDIYALGGVLSRKYALVAKSYTIFMVGLSLAVLLFVGVMVWPIVNG